MPGSPVRSSGPSRGRGCTYLRGLLGQSERENGWTLAEAAGEVSPDGMQRLLRTADWSADAVRDELRSYVVERLGPGGVLIVDETGFIGRHPLGRGGPAVHRHHGEIDKCQIRVFCAYATGTGRALIDRELFLPRAWTDDRDRARAAGIDDDVPFATKPDLARRMLQRALDAGMPAGWLTADEIYGQDRRLRVCCEQAGLPYVLATCSNDTVAAIDWRQRASSVEDTAAAALPYDNRDRAAARLRGQPRLLAVAAGATPDRSTFTVSCPMTHPGRHRGQVWFEWTATVEVVSGR
jgi:SRSO17 transposase